LQLTNQLIAEQKDKALATVDNKIEVLDFQKKSNIVMKNLLDKTIESNDKYQETIKEIRAIVLGGKKKIIDLLNLKHDDLDTIKLNLDFLIKKMMLNIDTIENIKMNNEHYNHDVDDNYLSILNNIKENQEEKLSLFEDLLFITKNNYDTNNNERITKLEAINNNLNHNLLEIRDKNNYLIKRNLILEEHYEKNNNIAQSEIITKNINDNNNNKLKSNESINYEKTNKKNK